MTKKKIGIILSFIVIIAIIILIIISLKNKNIEGTLEDEMVTVQKVTEEVLSESILVTGEVVPQNEQKVYQDAEQGDIKEFFIEENQVVKAGDVLFTYDTSKIESEFNKAIRTRDSIQATLNNSQKQIDILNKQIQQAKNTPTPVTTDEEGEQDVSAPIDVSSLESEKVQAQSELNSIQSEFESAQEEINELEKTKNDLNVKSKIDGLVVKVNQNVEKVEGGSGEVTVHIISNEPFNVIGTMSEFDTVKIKEKQAVNIQPKVFKDKKWKGVVESVSQFPIDSNGDGGMESGGGNVTMYPFKVKITDDTSELRQGFHVSLEVLISGSDKKVAVPFMALFNPEDLIEGEDENMDDSAMFDDMGSSIEEDESNETNIGSHVYVLKDNKLELREVETAEVSDEFVAIKSGLEVNDLVVIMPTASMKDGMEVTSYDEVK